MEVPKGPPAGSTLTVEEQEALSGATTYGISMVGPEPMEHVKEDIAKHSELLKSMLKACEFREAMRKQK